MSTGTGRDGPGEEIRRALREHEELHPGQAGQHRAQDQSEAHQGAGQTMTGIHDSAKTGCSQEDDFGHPSR